MTSKLFRAMAGIVICSALSLTVAAQTTLDLNPPSITHAAAQPFSPGKSLQIEVNITDDSGIEEAKVFYRASQVGNFQSAPLVLSFADKYIAEIPTEKGQKTLQYYIEALDTGGNRVLEGNPSQPLIIASKSRSNLLYVVLGAVAVGALAAAAGGSDDDGGSNPNTRSVTINATVPQ